jgi:predicted nucleotidyltransferase/biotin operon repressor
MDVGSPHRAVVAGLDGDVLVLLAGTTQPMSGREIAERLGLRSHDGVRKSLQRLTSQGIVVREGFGNAYLHRLNREHLGAAAVLALAAMRTALWTRIRETVAPWQIQPAHLSAFGSAARGDGDSESDIDLLVVRSTGTPELDATWLEQVEGLRERVEAWTGNRVSIIELADQELTQLMARPQDQPVLRAVLTEGIDLAGTPARRLLGALVGS